jgi:hypothetical protein
VAWDYRLTTYQVSNNIMVLIAREFLNHIKAGLTLAGQDEEGNLEWIGTSEQWTKLMWLQDGVAEENIY